jgi:hypothetical protein
MWILTRMVVTIALPFQTPDRPTQMGMEPVIHVTSVPDLMTMPIVIPMPHLMAATIVHKLIIPGSRMPIAMGTVMPVISALVSMIIMMQMVMEYPMVATIVQPQ